jgi:hypothetical protein
LGLQTKYHPTLKDFYRTLLGGIVCLEIDRGYCSRTGTMQDKVVEVFLLAWLNSRSTLIWFSSVSSNTMDIQRARKRVSSTPLPILRWPWR